MKMIQNTKKSTMTATLRAMLTRALLLCDAPVLPKATMARRRAGMDKARPRRESPQKNNVKIEQARAHIAIPE